MAKRLLVPSSYSKEDEMEADEDTQVSGPEVLLREHQATEFAGHGSSGPAGGRGRRRQW